MDKKIIVLLVIIAILAVGLGYSLLTLNHDTEKPVVNNTTINNTTKNNTTLEKTSTNSESGKYGYCAICGKALSYSEATSEYTQGKVCKSCANNPYYQSGEGAKYANQKLEEAYPDEYGRSYEDPANEEYYYG